MMFSRKFLVPLVGLAAAASFGCNNNPTPGATGAPSTGAPATSAPSTPAPVSVSTPTVALAADAGFDKAKSLKGHKEVSAMKNPVANDIEATKKGAELFAMNCASCHGPAGAGDGPAGMALNPKPRNMTVSGDYKYGAGDLGIFRTTKYGVDGTGMAPWEGRMSDEDTWKVVNFVRTLQKS